MDGGAEMKEQNIYTIKSLMEKEPELKESTLRKWSRRDDFHEIGFHEGNKPFFRYDDLMKWLERRERIRCL